MSTASTGKANSNQLVINRDTSKIFVRNNRYQEKNYINNSGYNPITLKLGTVMARLYTTGNLTPFVSSGTNGEKYPIGILAQDYVVDGSDTQEVTIVDMGDVVEDQLVFTKPGDGIDTIITDRRVRDLLASMGIKLVGSIDMTRYDNQ